MNKCFILAISVCLCFQLVGCCKKKNRQINNSSDSSASSKYRTSDSTQNNQSSSRDLSVPDEASKILKKTGLSYSIDRRPEPMTPNHNSSFFEKQYLEGIKYLEAEEFGKALQVFKDILSQYPDGEEASIATLCIAEIFFRNKNNEGALSLYKEILKKYPGTQAAQNAAEGIKYLESFEKLEKSFISPEKEDKRRRRR